MPRGGARSRSGPAPDPNALRRERDGKDWVKLPGAGRQGDTPPWPEHMSEPNMAELALWTRLWGTPQALVWEADGVADHVALYVRQRVMAGQEDASIGRVAIVARLAAELLLTTPALHAARYVIDKDLAPVDPDRNPNTPAATDSSASVRNLFAVAPDPDDAED